MTSETDYSIRRTVGAREIPGLRPVADRDQRRKRRRHREQAPADEPEEEAVQVELTDEQVDTGEAPADEQDSPPEGPAVDYLA